MKVYFICGLAADSRVFKHITLPSHHQPVYLDWISPQENESLTSYAIRLAKDINTNEEFSLIGLSMGGMVAIEIAKKFLPAFTILISSIPTSDHLPKYYRVAGSLNLHHLIPIALLQRAAVLKRSFTSETSEDKEMLKDMIRKSDPIFIRWAMSAVLNWQNKNIPKNLFQIHGERDAILPHRYTTPTYTILTGGHLMIMNHAPELNKILRKILTIEKASI